MRFASDVQDRLYINIARLNKHGALPVTWQASTCVFHIAPLLDVHQEKAKFCYAALEGFSL